MCNTYIHIDTPTFAAGTGSAKWRRQDLHVHLLYLHWLSHTHIQARRYTIHTATHCNTLQHTATYCNTLQHIHTYIHDGIHRHTDIHTCAADSSSGKWRWQDFDVQLLCWLTTSPSTLSCTHTHKHIHAHGHTYMCNRYRVGPIGWLKLHIWDMTTICLKHIWDAYRVVTTHWIP